MIVEQRTMGNLADIVTEQRMMGNQAYALT